MYPPELVQPMKDDLTNVGFRQLVTSDEVDQAIQSSTGALLVVVNSVCGCAAFYRRVWHPVSVGLGIGRRATTHGLPLDEYRVSYWLGTGQRRFPQVLPMGV